MSTVMAASSVPESLAGAPGALVDAGEKALRLSEVTDETGFAGLRSAWDSAVQRDTEATIFQTWEWQYTWWRHFGRGKKPLILVFSDRTDSSAENALCAIAPLMLKPYVLPGIREVAFIGTGVSDYLDIISHPEWRSEAASAVFEHLRAGSHAWDFVDLHQIPPGDTAGCAGRLAGEDYPGFRAELLDHETCPVVELPGSWDEYRSSLGKSLRFNIGYYERCLAKQYDVRIGLATAEDLDSEMESLFLLHSARWRKRRLPGVLSGQTIRAFHQETASRFLDRGWLRLYYLRLDGVTRASLYCFAFGGRMYYYLGGFDPAFAKYGLGVILTARAIRDAIEAGLSTFDMLRGCEDYKLRWKPTLRMNSRLFIHKPDPRSGLARVLHRAEGRIEHGFKNWVNRPRGAAIGRSQP